MYMYVCVCLNMKRKTLSRLHCTLLYFKSCYCLKPGDSRPTVSRCTAGVLQCYTGQWYSKFASGLAGIRPHTAMHEYVAKSPLQFVLSSGFPSSTLRLVPMFLCQVWRLKLMLVRSSVWERSILNTERCTDTLNTCAGMNMWERQQGHGSKHRLGSTSQRKGRNCGRVKDGQSPHTPFLKTRRYRSWIINTGIEAEVRQRSQLGSTKRVSNKSRLEFLILAGRKECNLILLSSHCQKMKWVCPHRSLWNCKWSQDSRTKLIFDPVDP